MPRGSHENHVKSQRHYRWNVGGKLASNGYVKVRVGKGHPLADPNGYAYEHLVVWCSAGNKRPEKGFVIHHLNHDKTDNRIENLSLAPRGKHNVHHNKEKGRDGKGRFIGKKAAGYLLDGQEWRLVPEVGA